MPLSKAAQQELFSGIDAIPILQGAGVAYVGGNACTVLRPSAHQSGFDTWVVLEETPLQYEPNGNPKAPDAKVNAKSSNVRRELISAGLNCGGAVLAGAAATAGAAAAPVTGGTSTVVTYVAGAAAVAAAAQCGLSVGRLIGEAVDPGSSDELDKLSWYKGVEQVLDGLSLASIAGGAKSAFKNLGRVLEMRRSTGKPLIEILKGVSKPERKRLAKEVATATEGLSNKQWKALVRAGKMPAIYTQTAINATIREQLVTHVGNVLGVYSSATAGNIGVLVHVLQE